MAKFLFDFDGVLTDQTDEATRVRGIFRERIIALSGATTAETDAVLDRGEAAMNARPWEHGWRVKGRVSAFADEDLFIRNNGLAACLDAEATTDRRLGEMRAAVAGAGYADFCALAQFAYEEMARETKAGAHEPIDPAAAPVIRSLLDAGHDLVVVSNSGTDRIVRILSGCGLDPKAHADDSSARLRVRGGARKFELAEKARGFDVGQYAIETARPVYESILLEERPAGVIGDVFSLDLALPLHLARTDTEFRGMKIIMRLRHYSPNWSRNFVETAREERAVLRAIDRIADLAEIFV